MARRGASVQQTSHRLMCDALRGVLQEAVDSGGGDRIAVGSVPCRAVAGLYMLLLNHPVDRRGRCRSCRRPGAVLGGRWRRCRVHGEAALWLNQPAEFLGAQLIRELGLNSSDDACAHETALASSLDNSDVLPRMIAESDDPPPTPQSPAALPPPFLPGGFPRAGRPDPDHGEAGERPERPWLRRGPSDDGDGSVKLTV